MAVSEWCGGRGWFLPVRGTVGGGGMCGRWFLPVGCVVVVGVCVGGGLCLWGGVGQWWWLSLARCLFACLVLLGFCLCGAVVGV